jgi:hypothetical protein
VAKKVSGSRFSAILRAKADQLNAAGINGVRKAGAKLIVLLEHHIRNNSPFPLVDRGRLVQSNVLVLTPDGCIVRNDAPYAAPLEYGARPFAPPIQPLIDWAARKGFADPKAVAWAVRQTFKTKGMKPKRFFAKALAQWKADGDLPKAVHKALAAKTPAP